MAEAILVGCVLLIWAYATALHVWLIILAFRTHILWGLASLIPLGTFIFAVTHWRATAKPLLLYIIGVPILVVSLVLATMYTPLGNALDKYRTQADETRADSEDASDSQSDSGSSSSSNSDPEPAKSPDANVDAPRNNP